jgi:anti-sigma factor RsiW
MRAHITDRDYENLSAFLDGQLAPSDQKKLEERLRTRPELQQALEELTRTRALLRSAPRRRAPRNFTLTPAMVGERRQARGGGWFAGLFPTLSFASALATLALVLALAFELLPGSQGALMTSQPVADTVMTEPAGGRAMDSARQAPAMEAAEMAAPEMESPAMAAPESMPVEDAPGMAVMVEPETGMKAAPGFGDFTANPGMGGGGTGAFGGVYAAPPPAWGMGGANGYFDHKGYAPQWTIPLAGVASLDPEEFMRRSPVEALAQPPSEITGAGPILGVPSPEQSGQIQVQSGWGLPLEVLSGPTLEYERNPGSGSQVMVVDQPRVFGLSNLRLAQILLALLAVGLGAAAFLARRRANRA